MKKILISLLLLSLTVLPVAAQEASDSANQSLTDKIKERLQETAEQGLDTIKSALTEQASAPRPKAYVGTVSAVNDTNLQLQFKNDLLLVNFNDDTDIIQVRGRAALKPEDLKIDDFLLAFGFVYPDNEALTAIEIQRISKPTSPPPRQLISGLIEEIDGNELTVSGKTLTVGARTKLSVSGVENPDLENLALDDYLFALVTLDANGDIDTVNNLLVQPGKNNPLGEVPTNQGATESATATESAN